MPKMEGRLFYFRNLAGEVLENIAYWNDISF